MVITLRLSDYNGLQCLLAYVWVRSEGGPGWASPQHPLAGVTAKTGWAATPAS